MTCFPVHYRYRLPEYNGTYSLCCIFLDEESLAARIARHQEVLYAILH